MELYTMTPTFQPDKLVENFESLIWTERYNKAGDFQLTATNISETMKALPRETCVTLRDSTVPMLIEFHKIEKKKGEAPKLTVIGRSYEACALERRASVKEPLGATTKSAWVITTAKESDAAYMAIRTVIGDTARYQGGSLVLSSISPAVSPNDALPSIDLTLPADYGVAAWSSTKYYMQNELVSYGGSYYLATGANGNLNQIPSSSPTFWTVTTSTKNFEIKTGELYSTILELIVANNHGIKSVRPSQNGSKIGVEIYNGADRTSKVVFDARFDQFDSANYLLGAQGSTNVAYVYGYLGSQQVLKTTAAEPSGMDRRVLVLDETSDQTTNNSDVRRTRGLVELYKNNATALFDGEIAQQVASGYNKDYFLGDLIKLTGEYGLSQNVRVAEFIRSADAQGEKAYPTFEAVT